MDLDGLMRRDVDGLLRAVQDGELDGLSPADLQRLRESVDRRVREASRRALESGSMEIGGVASPDSDLDTEHERWLTASAALEDHIRAVEQHRSPMNIWDEGERADDDLADGEIQADGTVIPGRSEAAGDALAADGALEDQVREIEEILDADEEPRPPTPSPGDAAEGAATQADSRPSSSPRDQGADAGPSDLDALRGMTPAGLVDSIETGNLDLPPEEWEALLDYVNAQVAKKSRAALEATNPLGFDTAADEEHRRWLAALAAVEAAIKPSIGIWDGPDGDVDLDADTPTDQAFEYVDGLLSDDGGEREGATEGDPSEGDDETDTNLSWRRPKALVPVAGGGALILAIIVFLVVALMGGDEASTRVVTDVSDTEESTTTEAPTTSTSATTTSTSTTTTTTSIPAAGAGSSDSGSSDPTPTAPPPTEAPTPTSPPPTEAPPTTEAQPQSGSKSSSGTFPCNGPAGYVGYPSVTVNLPAGATVTGYSASGSCGGNFSESHSGSQSGDSYTVTWRVECVAEGCGGSATYSATVNYVV